ncbi:MAG: twin-arginine translocase subunit TatC [Solirubrobacteraceae bacterium]
MAVAVKALGHEDRRGVVEHLEELRSRLIVSLAVVVAAFAVCFWQNHALLHLINKPLASRTQTSQRGPVLRLPLSRRRRWRCPKQRPTSSRTPTPALLSPG